jgi:hypothetical protein
MSKYFDRSDILFFKILIGVSGIATFAAILLLGATGRI